MSITPSTPVVQGSAKASLQREGDALLLSRRHDEVRIPLAAIAQVRAEGRSLAVELTAPAGATSYAHRIDGVSEAAAAMFAAAVNADLPEAAGRDTTADGTALVETRDRPVSRRERKTRLMKRWAAATLGLLVLLCVLVAVAGQPIGILILTPAGLVGAASSVAGVIALTDWHRERRLMRHGITAFAAEVPERPGQYLYVDPAGMIRNVFTWPGGIAVKVSYDPRDPGNVVLPRRAFSRRAELCAGLIFAGLGLVTFAALIAVTVGVLLGTLDF
ncbi:hypothetical protein [Streptomyces sp. NPDC056169]|uniref:hypothetical protein n=1 Tax=Streptomyces sp. NPDC056169 TaxID=3345734 RepID=UPI0035D6432D